MTMIGYDPGRLAGLRSRAQRAAEALGAVRSDDPAAAEAMAAVAAARRNLEDGVLGLIGRINASDPMGSWSALGVTGEPSGWRAMPAGADAPRNCSQPQPALCENSPVRSWFGPGYEVFGGRVTNVEWLSIEGFGEFRSGEPRRSDAEWEGMDGVPILEMFSGGTQSTTWTVRNAYVEYSYASVDRAGDMADPVPRAAFVGDVEVTEHREYTTFQPEVGLPVGGPPGSRSADPTAELDIELPMEQTIVSTNATYSIRMLEGNPVPVGLPLDRSNRTYYREIPLTDLESADED